MSALAPDAHAGVDAWLEWQLTLHEQEIELGLERVAAVADTLGVRAPAARSVVVAGTNGKGSCAALIAALAGGTLRTGVYSSPHLWRYNERIAIDGRPVLDAALCRAFAAVEAARGATPLTYFEYGTLAALWLFVEAGVELAVLEVGLGGRLDAVNVVDADVALITNIGLDHTAWLGDTRAAIGREKAGVMRAGRAALCGDRRPPASISGHAEKIGAELALIGRDFDLEAPAETRAGAWRWSRADATLCFPAPVGVLADNLACALAVADRLGLVYAATDVLHACRAQARLPGRREIVDGRIPIIYDVAHNAEAVTVLADTLTRTAVAGRTHVVIGMLDDKPVEAVAALLAPAADAWYPAALDGMTPRGLDAMTIRERLQTAGPVIDRAYAEPAGALAAALAASVEGDRIVVCGSFHTVARARAD